jgi:tetratricopeptide (TPR) repeat protein
MFIGVLVSLMLAMVYYANVGGLEEASLGAELTASAGDPHQFLELSGRALAYDSWSQDEVVGSAADALQATGAAGNPAYSAASTAVAAELERQVTTVRNPDPRALFRLGSLCQAMATTDATALSKAERTFQKTIQKWPGGYYGLGGTYLMEGKIDEALVLFKKAVEINPSNGTARWMYAFPPHLEPSG